VLIQLSANTLLLFTIWYKNTARASRPGKQTSFVSTYAKFLLYALTQLYVQQLRGM